MTPTSLTSCFFSVIEPLSIRFDPPGQPSSQTAFSTWKETIVGEICGRLVYSCALVGSMATLPIDLIQTTFFGLAAFFGAVKFGAVKSSDNYYLTFLCLRKETDLNMRLFGGLLFSLFSIKSIFLKFYPSYDNLPTAANQLIKDQFSWKTFKTLRQLLELRINQENDSFDQTLSRGLFAGLTTGVFVYLPRPFIPACSEKDFFYSTAVKKFTIRKISSTPSKSEIASGMLHSLVRRISETVWGIMYGFLMLGTFNLYPSSTSANASQTFSSSISLGFDLIARACQLAQPSWADKEAIEASLNRSQG